MRIQIVRWLKIKLSKLLGAIQIIDGLQDVLVFLPEHLGDDQAIGDGLSVFDADQRKGFFGRGFGGKSDRLMADNGRWPAAGVLLSMSRRTAGAC